MAQPWASGPREILEHALSLLANDRDVNRRLAMILIDNSVELMMKTYLALPKRVTGINLSRPKYAEISESFPKLLDAFEEHALDKLDGVDLGSIEWYHRLRNQLYHEGNGLTVERQKVDVYAELARLLYKNLFLEDVRLTPASDLLGDFLNEWNRLEKTLSDLAVNLVRDGRKRLPATASVQRLMSVGKLSPSEAKSINDLRLIRNDVVHAEVDYTGTINEMTLDTLRQLNEDLATRTLSR